MSDSTFAKVLFFVAAVSFVCALIYQIIRINRQNTCRIAATADLKGSSVLHKFLSNDDSLLIKHQSTRRPVTFQQIEPEIYEIDSGVNTLVITFNNYNLYKLGEMIIRPHTKKQFRIKKGETIIIQIKY